MDANIIKNRCKKLGLTFGDLGAMAGYVPQSVRNSLSGGKPLASRMAVKLMKTLDDYEFKDIKKDKNEELTALLSRAKDLAKALNTFIDLHDK